MTLFDQLGLSLTSAFVTEQFIVKSLAYISKSLFLRLHFPCFTANVRFLAKGVSEIIFELRLINHFYRSFYSGDTLH